MLTSQENDLLCRIEGDAPMGRMIRRYWLPVIPSADLEVDGPPRLVRLLGEDLVAFRDSSGRVGLLDESCPHRGASLVLARNENCGLRCLYHGWKYDVEGRILETPPEPDDLNFRNRIRARAYTARDAGGMIWAYMGPAGSEPPPLDFEFAQAPTSHVLVMNAITDCNWAQCLEGALDSAHSNYLHSNGIRPGAAGPKTVYKPDASHERPSNDGAPRIEVQNTAYGFRYGAIRKPILDADKNAYVRVTLFVAPFYVLIPAPEGFSFFQAFVPIDNTHSRFVFLMYKHDEPLNDEERAKLAKRSGLLVGDDLDSDYRPIRNRHNLWMQDRKAMREGSFSGIAGINTEDIAMQESMGPRYDRSQEHLGTSDVAVIRMRRLMLESVRAFTEDGRPPIGLAEPVPYGQLRAEEATIPLTTPWQTVGARAGEPVIAN